MRNESEWCACVSILRHWKEEEEEEKEEDMELLATSKDEEGR